jgi:hypothetical protein
MAAANTGYSQYGSNNGLKKFYSADLRVCTKILFKVQLLLYLNKLECLTTSDHFHPSLIFAGKVINISL